MSEPIPPPANQSPAAAPRRGLLRFLFKTLPGLALVALALLAGTVALAPALGGGFAKGYASDWFAEHYRGKLAIASLDLGWSGPQRIEGVELLDPDGAPVARVSMTLPGLWSVIASGGKRLGKLEVRAEASLARGADGRTNLDRALEPREPAKEAPSTGGEDGGSSSFQLADLDVELDLQVARLSFEDERTRALGAPFVLEDLAVNCRVRPGEPVTARARGTLSGSAKGALSLDARIEHPFEAPSSATPPKAEIAGLVERFPSALLDALAGQEGKLEALLGEQLSLHLSAQGTVQEGTFDLRVEAPRAEVRASARIAGGVLRSQEGGVAAELELAPGFLELALRDALQGGATLTRLGPAAGGPPPRVSFALSEFEAPVGAFLEASVNGRGDEALDALLAGVRAHWSSELGDWRFEDPAHAAAGPLTVHGLRFGGELKAPEETSRIEFALDAAAGNNPPGTARVTIEFAGGAALARLAPSAALAPARVHASLKDVPAALFEPFAQSGGDLARALGEKIALELSATAALEAEPSSDLTWAGAADRWRELARRATAEFELDLRGSARGEPLQALGGQPFSVRSMKANAKLALAAPVELRALLEFDAPASGRLELNANLSNAFSDPGAKQPLRFSLTSSASGLPARAAGAAAGQGERAEQLLGKLLALEAKAEGTLDDGTARVQLTSDSAQIVLAGRLQDGVFVQHDGPALRVALQPDARLLEELAAPHLPPGARLAFSGSRGAIGVEIATLSLPVQELLEAAKPPGDRLVAVALAKTQCAAVIEVREFVYEDEALRAAGRKIDKLALTAELGLSPGDKATPLKLGVELASAAWPAFPIALRVEAPHAPALLSVAQGAAFAPITVIVSGKELPTALLDVYAGGALAPALGPKLELALDARLEQPEGKPFTAKAALELGSGSARSMLQLAASAVDPFDPAKKRPEGVPPELEASLGVDGAGLLLAFAPADARDALRSLCGEKIAARVAVASSAKDALRADLSLDAGAISAKGALDYEGRVAKSVAKSPLEVRVAPSPATLELLLAGKLPEGATLKFAEAGGALTVKLDRIEVPVGRYLDAEPAAATAELLAGSTLGLTAELPAFVYTHPAAAGQPGTPVALRNVLASAVLEPGKPATLDVTGDVEAKPPGKLAIHVVATQPAGLAATPPAAGSSAKLAAELSHFPSALLDVLAQQDGLLVDVLGPELDAKVSGVYPDQEAEPLRAELHSALGDISLESRIVDGQIVTKGEQGLDAKIGVTPLFSKRIVGSLVPMLVSVRQDDPAQRSIVTGRKLKLPMDGDMSKLNGDIVLDLGAVQYDLAPALSQALELGGAKGANTAKLQPIPVKIKNGVARYDSLPLRIGGRDIAFRGSADLVQSTFELAFEVPLEMLGSKVESQIEALRGTLDPKMKVPLELHGTWKNPRVRLGKGFMEKVLKEAAENELEKGLGGLLGGDKKKKKKKDG